MVYKKEGAGTRTEAGTDQKKKGGMEREKEVRGGNT